MCMWLEGFSEVLRSFSGRHHRCWRGRAGDRRRVSRRTREVVVLESAARTGQATSSRSSQVLHSGLDHPKGSLKARLCVAGNRALPSWCEMHGVPLRRVGKLIVATTDPEQTELEELLRRAEANGVEGIMALDGSDVRSLEPSVCAVAALWVPSTGILEARTLVDSLARAAVDRGVIVALRHHLMSLEPEPGGLVARGGVGAGLLSAPCPVGDQRGGAPCRCHRVPRRPRRRRAGLPPTLGQGALRAGARRAPSRAPGLPACLRRRCQGWGLDLTIGLDGDVRLGPDVVPLETRVEDYAVDEGCLAAFHEAARRFIPSLSLDELAADTSGIYSSSLDPEGRGATSSWSRRAPMGARARHPGWHRVAWAHLLDRAGERGRCHRLSSCLRLCPRRRIWSVRAPAWSAIYT